jgi:hypothetical protein
MAMRLVTVTALTFVMFLGGCAGDSPAKKDSTPPTPDGSIGWPDTGGPDTVSPGWEGGTQPDTLPPPDLGPVEGGAGGKSCGEIADCAKSCTDMTCVSTCLGTGCPSAQTTANALLSCGASYCLASCMTGFSQACLDCLSTNCPTEYAACENHSC